MNDAIIMLSSLKKMYLRNVDSFNLKTVFMSSNSKFYYKAQSQGKTVKSKIILAI